MVAVVCAIVVLAAFCGWMAYRGRHDRVWMVMHAYTFYTKGQIIDTRTIPWRQVAPAKRITVAGDKPQPGEATRWVVVKVLGPMHVRVRPLADVPNDGQH